MAEVKADQKYLTLILGAGASMPYGFPSGPKLVKDIITAANRYSQNSVQASLNSYDQNRDYALGDDYISLCSFFRDNGYSNLKDSDVAVVSEIIVKQLSLYQPTSIDSYLGNLYNGQDHISKFHADLCKYFIGNAIAAHYDLKKYSISINDDQPKWLQHLFNAIFYYLHKRKYAVEDLPIKIITFNYDTLLEQHFFDWVKQSTFLPEEQQNKVIRLFCKSIRHVYGQIGFLADQNVLFEAPENCTTKECLPILKSIDAGSRRLDIRDMALHSIKRIGLVNYGTGEDATLNRANQQHIADARTWLQNTSTLIISGYAFDEENNEQLDLQNSAHEIPQIYCTAFQAGFSLIENIKSIFHNHKNSHGNWERDKWLDGQFLGGHKMFSNGLRLYNSTTLDMLSKEINLVKLTSKL